MNWKMVVLTLGLAALGVILMVSPNTPFEARSSAVAILVLIAGALPGWLHQGTKTVDTTTTTVTHKSDTPPPVVTKEEP